MNRPIKRKIIFFTLIVSLYLLGSCKPSNVVGHIRTPYDIWDMTISGNHAYLVGKEGSLYVIDISNPAKPNEIGSCVTYFDGNSIDISGSYAYLGSYGLYVVDISSPSSPFEVGDYHVPIYYSRDIDISGNYAFTAQDDLGLLVFDISNPSDPKYVADFDLEGAEKSISISGDIAYIGTEAYNKGGFLGVVDISDPLQPRTIGVYNAPDMVNGVAIAGNFAYLSNTKAGLRVVDISDPATPIEVGLYDPLGTVVDVAVSGHYAYLATYARLTDAGLPDDYPTPEPEEVGLHVVDISDPTNPTLVSIYPTSSPAIAVGVSNGYIYVATFKDGLFIFEDVK